MTSEEERQPNSPTPTVPPQPAVGGVPDMRATAPRPARPRKPLLPPVDHPEFDDHEQVLAHFDPETGLSAIIAVHSTARGPAIGGCRMKLYASTSEALADVLRLSKGMSYKCAMVDLPMGGAKSVIIGDPEKAKTPRVLAEFARRVEKLGGDYWTAEDASISTNDVAMMAWRTKYVVGRDEGPAPSGNPAPVTAKGVVLGIEVAIAERGGSGLKDTRIAVLGVGDVGERIATMAAEAGAKVTVADKDAAKAAKVAKKIGARDVGVEALWTDDTEVFCPCALGGSITAARVQALNAEIVAGAENNQLQNDAAGDDLRKRGILYAPDYELNAGGLINCYAEVVAVQNGVGFSEEWVQRKLNDIPANLATVFKLAKDRDLATHHVADEEARRRIGRF